MWRTRLWSRTCSVSSANASARFMDGSPDDTSPQSFLTHVYGPHRRRSNGRLGGQLFGPSAGEGFRDERVGDKLADVVDHHRHHGQRVGLKVDVEQVKRDRQRLLAAGNGHGDLLGTAEPERL